jgi:hypothetical protein
MKAKAGMPHTASRDRSLADSLEPLTLRIRTSGRPSPGLSSSAGGPHGATNITAVAGVSAVLCAALLLKLALASGPVGSDDIVYFRGADQIVRDGAIAGQHYHHMSARKLFILLAGLPAALGEHIIYGVLANILYTLLLEIAVVLFVFSQLGAAPALIAAVVTGLSGVGLLWSGTLHPDVTVSLFMFLSVALLYFGLLPRARSPGRLIALSGALVGLAYAVKEPAMLLLPPALLSILLLRTDVKLAARLIWSAIFIAAVGAMLALEGLLQLWLSGDFFYRYSAVQAGVAAPPLPLIEFMRRTYWSAATIATSDRHLLLLPAIAAAVCWTAAILRRSPFTVFAISGVFVGGYLIFGTTSFPQLRPMPDLQPRFLHPLFPLLAVSMAALFAQTHQKRRYAAHGWWFFISIFAMVSVSAAVAEAGNLARARYFKNVTAALQWQLAREPDAPIMVDPSTLEMLWHFMPRADYARLQPIPRSELREGYYLVDPFQDSIVRLGRAPHFEEIMKLPIVITVDLNPFLLSRYLPDFRSDELRPGAVWTASIRKK